MASVTVDSITDDGTPVDDSLITVERERERRGRTEKRRDDNRTERNSRNHCDDLASNRDRDNNNDDDNDRDRDRCMNRVRVKDEE